jgi:hypothetical protein
MKKLSNNILGFALLLTVLFPSCKKESIGDSDQSDIQLEISLNQDYLPIAKVDSAILLWEANGMRETLKLQENGNKLKASLKDIQNDGPGILALQLFTQTKVDGKPLQWEKRFPYTLKRSIPVKLQAPVDFKDDSWSPRVICKSEINGAGFTAIIALRPEDSYFELKGVDLAISDRIEIVRSFYHNDTTNLVASRGWIGTAANLDNKGNLLDRDHFRNLEEQIDGRVWNKYKIRASFYNIIPNHPHENYEFEFEQDKP